MPKKVLLAEDEKVLSKILSHKLEKAGIEVIKADNGQEAIAKAKEQVPDLMLLDILMPGKDGFEVLEALKEAGLTKKIYIVVASNLGQETNKEMVKKLGAKDYIVKADTPVEELVEYVLKKLKK